MGERERETGAWESFQGSTPWTPEGEGSAEGTPSEREPHCPVPPEGKTHSLVPSLVEKGMESLPEYRSGCYPAESPRAIQSELTPDQRNRCCIAGSGLHSGSLGALCSFTVISKNKVEEPREQPRVTVLHKESGRALQPSIQDNHDGTFQISYTPTEVGQLSVSVCVKGCHIKGSPFNVTVKGTPRSHPGIYHCCTFCSSGGQKDARCGCGGTMPGGYQGCGHGHKGHPGRSHWSCCGSILEKSECSGVKDSAPRNLLRTVAL